MIINSRSLKDALLLNSQQIIVRFALRYLQVFVPLRLKTCRLYDKKDLFPALFIQFVRHYTVRTKRASGKADPFDVRTSVP